MQYIDNNLLNYISEKAPCVCGAFCIQIVFAFAWFSTTSTNMQSIRKLLLKKYRMLLLDQQF